MQTDWRSVLAIERLEDGLSFAHCNIGWAEMRRHFFNLTGIVKFKNVDHFHGENLSINLTDISRMTVGIGTECDD